MAKEYFSEEQKYKKVCELLNVARRVQELANKNNVKIVFTSEEREERK